MREAPNLWRGVLTVGNSTSGARSSRVDLVHTDAGHRPPQDRLGHAWPLPGPRLTQGGRRLVRARTFARDWRAYPSTIERRADRNDHDHRKTDRRQFCSVFGGHRNLGAESWRIRSRRLIFAFSGFVQLVRLSAGLRVGVFLARIEASSPGDRQPVSRINNGSASACRRRHGAGCRPPGLSPITCLLRLARRRQRERRPLPQPRGGFEGQGQSERLKPESRRNGSVASSHLLAGRRLNLPVPTRRPAPNEQARSRGVRERHPGMAGAGRPVPLL